MAIWQFKFEVVPSERIADRSEIDASEFDESRWWSHRQPAMDFRQRLATLLPPAKSWHDLLLWFGEEGGGRFDGLENRDAQRGFARARKPGRSCSVSTLSVRSILPGARPENRDGASVCEGPAVDLPHAPTSPHRAWRPRVPRAQPLRRPHEPVSHRHGLRRLPRPAQRCPPTNTAPPAVVVHHEQPLAFRRLAAARRRTDFLLSLADPHARDALARRPPHCRVRPPLPGALQELPRAAR